MSNNTLSEESYICETCKKSFHKRKDSKGRFCSLKCSSERKPDKVELELRKWIDSLEDIK